MDDDFVNSYTFSIYQAVPTAIFILFPMSMKKDMSAFRYASLGSIAALVYTSIVLIAEFPKFHNLTKDNAEGKIAPVFWDLNLLTGASMTFFAF